MRSSASARTQLRDLVDEQEETHFDEPDRRGQVRVRAQEGGAHRRVR